MTSQESILWKAEDGIVCHNVFNEEKIKILWVLREPNGENFDFMKYLKNPTVYNKWKQSYGLVVKASLAIFNKASEADKKYPYPKTENVPEVMSRIALINIKKTGGKSRSKHKQLAEYAAKHRQEFESQILDILPDLVICAGTGRYIPNEQIKIIQEKSRKQIKFLKMLHTNQTKVKHCEYIKTILGSLN